jgi:two-component system sensor histidine kinase KdpD
MAAQHPLLSRFRPWRAHLQSLGVVAAAATLAWGLEGLAHVNPAMVLLLGVLVSGLAWGLWPALTAAAAAAVALNFLFLEPRFTFEISAAGDVFTFAVFFAVALAAGYLSGRVRDQAQAAAERAKREQALMARAADAEALRRADRLRSALLNSISHDLRTPLSTVLGSATTLIDYGKTLEPEVQRDLLESIREEAERLSRYVGDLLDMTRLEVGGLVTRKDWIDVRDVLRAALEHVERRRGRRELATDFARELTLVKADPGLLEQALANILENAIAYSDDASRIEAAVYEDQAHVVIAIEDEGRGIPAGELDAVFEKFHRYEEGGDRVKGAGLGLAIAKGFVEAMGGRIAAASPIHQGRGTRILISLPKELTTPAFLL